MSIRPHSLSANLAGCCKQAIALIDTSQGRRPLNECSGDFA
jgi:hypothetical protein